MSWVFAQPGTEQWVKTNLLEPSGKGVVPPLLPGSKRPEMWISNILCADLHLHIVKWKKVSKTFAEGNPHIFGKHQDAIRHCCYSSHSTASGCLYPSETIFLGLSLDKGDEIEMAAIWIETQLKARQLEPSIQEVSSTPLAREREDRVATPETRTKNKMLKKT